MKTILRIVKLELNTLFYSPVAWLVLIIFIFQTGVSFAELFEQNIKYAKLGTNEWSIRSYTYQIFINPRGLFSAVVHNLYLYIPLLTMGLMSREISSGSVKLLFSSPIKLSEIILGKFLSMAVYGFILIIILTFFVVAGAFSIEHLDIGNIISALIGIYLLICTYSAIGLFMSCLTSYQVVAAISTLVVFAALNFIGTVGQEIDFVRDLTYFISITGRTSELLSGLIRSNDVLYFIIVVIIFLGLSYLNLLHGRESKHRVIKLLRYVFFVAFMLTAGYVSSIQLLRGYVDMTARQSRTLTRSSQELIRKMDKPLTITTFVNILDYYASSPLLPAERNRNKALFESYMRFKPDIKINYVYYYDSLIDENWYRDYRGKNLEKLAKETAEALKINFRRLLSPEQINKLVDLSPEENRAVFQLNYDGRKTYLRMYNDYPPIPSEQEISAALKRLLIKPPKIYFLTGHNERSIFKSGDRDYKLLNTLTNRNALINQGFDLDTINLSNARIPEDITGLIIADPQGPLSQQESAKIAGYINNGGNVLISGKNGRQALLNPILQSFGVQVISGTLMQYSKDFPADFIVAQFHKPAEKDTVAGNLFYKGNENAKVSMPGSAAMTYEDTGAFDYYPILFANKETWSRPVNSITDATAAIFDPAKGDVKKELITALGITRNIQGRQQRIMVLGSADFMSNGEFLRQNMTSSNFRFTQNIFKWFANEEFPIDVSRPDPKDIKLNVEQSHEIWLRIVFLGILPGFLILLGSIILIRRRGR